MRILLASSEIHPFSKTGGLADMVGALAKSLATNGHQTAVVTPLYAGILEKHPGIQKTDISLDLPLGERQIQASVHALTLSELLTIYFIDQRGFYFRKSLYQENGSDYGDNADRFIFLSKCVVELSKRLPLQPEMVHVHDWQVGMVPLLIAHARRAGWGTAPRTCLTIHNLAYQGHFSAWHFGLSNLPWEYFNPDGAEFYGGLNCLKTAISFSDIITTVSPRYAREITTEEYGCGLDGVLRKREKTLIGILNGVDYEEWNTTHNRYLSTPYDTANLAGKEAAKTALQKELGLPQNPHIPLFGNVTRLADQKGVDIQLGALAEMLSANLQFVLLGSGSPIFENAYRDLAKRYPNKVAVKIGYDHALAHRIEAASDFFLMPSRFEPCGLNQMYSLRYGTIPVVRVTGGLDDSVTDINEDPDAADGIKFQFYSARALAKAIRKALVLYENSELLTHYRQNAMMADFSWDNTTRQYLEAYRRALAV